MQQPLSSRNTQCEHLVLQKIPFAWASEKFSVEFLIPSSHTLHWWVTATTPSSQQVMCIWYFPWMLILSRFNVYRDMYQEYFSIFCDVKEWTFTHFRNIDKTVMDRINISDHLFQRQRFLLFTHSGTQLRLLENDIQTKQHLWDKPAF